MTVRILIGDCRDRLRDLPDESVNCVVTSPPYWGLRDYGVEPSVWGGDLACEHVWGGVYVPPPGGKGTQSSGLNGAQTSAKYRERLQEQHQMKGVTTHFCSRCGAWAGAHGLEPDYNLFVENEVRIFRDVRRVLRADGTLWLNLGDSAYATGAGKVGDHPGGGAQGEAWAGRGNRADAAGKHSYAGTGTLTQPNRMPQPGLKPKDLCGIPWRVAFALQADGWWLRQDIIWSKPNPMPESITDRCTKAHEYLFLLSKSGRYFYDAKAVAEATEWDPSSTKMPDGWDTGPGGHGAFHRNGREKGKRHVPGNKSHKGTTAYEQGDDLHRTKAGLVEYAERQRSARDSFKRDGSKREQPIPGQSAGTHRPDREESNWDVATRNKRSVWTVATAPFSEAHFATFPPALIEPCILAGCPKGGTILDPFFGAGTSGLVADRLGRNCIGIELNESYALMAENRIRDDAGMMADVQCEAQAVPA